MSTTATCPTKPAAVLAFTRRYVNAGLSVVPILRGGTKAPACPWKRYQKDRPTPEELPDLFGKRLVGIAAVCGAVSGGLEMIDFDEDSLFEPFAELLNEAAPGLLDRLTHHRTPRPGRHLIYRCSVIEGSQKLALRLEGQDERGNPTTKTLLETKGEGGYFLVPGSPPDCHELRRSYEHIAGPPLIEVKEITPGERAILLSAARSLNEYVEEAPNGRQTTEHQPQRDGISPGDDFAAKATWQEIIEPHGWVMVGKSGQITRWRRPGKARGWSATTGCRSKQGNDLLCVFSSNAGPLQGPNGSRVCTSYTKFAAYTMLNHGEDFRAAAKALREKGYGERRDDEGRPGIADKKVQRGTAKSASNDQTHTEIRFEGIPCPVLARQHYQVEYLVKDMLVVGQPAIVGGAQKTLKTTIAWDLAISICTGKPFLNRFEVLRCARVGYMSGEGGLSVLQDIGRRVCAFKGLSLSDVTGMVVCDHLPRLDNAFHLKALTEFLLGNEVEILFVDPVYLCMAGADAGNVLSMGERLGAVNKVCVEAGVTPILLHHVKKADPRGPFAVPELSDLSWSGFAEFAGQWFLISRRSKYVPNPRGAHELLMSVGGRTGHSSLWALDIEEGVTGTEMGRYWHVEIRTPDDVRQDADETREAAREAERQKQIDRDAEKVRRAMAKYPDGETAKTIRETAGLNPPRFKLALAAILQAGDAVPCEVFKSNRKTPYEGYKLAE